MSVGRNEGSGRVMATYRSGITIEEKGSSRGKVLELDRGSGPHNHLQSKK